ncbi:MAG: hypothetical protein FWE22_08630 [Firmicutes bacterium]|nr:hypothetical protein [Bacillota bacterium]
MKLTILLTYKNDFKDCKTSPSTTNAMRIVQREHKTKGLKNALIAYGQGKIFANLDETHFTSDEQLSFIN